MQNLQIGETVTHWGHMTLTMGDRLKLVREERGDDQETFVELFNERAKRYGLRVRMDKTKLSRTENGREISLGEGVVFMSLDKKRRSLVWLALGREYETRGGAGEEPDGQTARTAEGGRKSR